MNTKQKIDQELADDENPAWTKTMFNEATTLEESSLPDSFKQSVRQKTPISIRLSPNVVDYFRGTGKGWQTRIDEVLGQYVAEHKHGLR